MMAYLEVDDDEGYMGSCVSKFSGEARMYSSYWARNWAGCRAMLDVVVKIIPIFPSGLTSGP